MSDLNTKLLNQNLSYPQLFEEGRNKVDFIQRENKVFQQYLQDQLEDDEDDQSFSYQYQNNRIQYISEFREKINQEINDLKSLFIEMDKNVKGYKAKQDLKKLKQTHRIEFERFQTIMKNALKQSFDSSYNPNIFQSSNESQQQSIKQPSVLQNKIYQNNDNNANNKQTCSLDYYDEYGEDEDIKNDQIQMNQNQNQLLNKQNQIQSGLNTHSLNQKYSTNTTILQSSQVYSQEQIQKQKYYMLKKEQEEKQKQLMILQQSLNQKDQQLEESLLEEKQKQINKVESDMTALRRVMEDIGQEVVQQGNLVEVIIDDLSNAHANTIDAHNEMLQANSKQKSSKKKYVILILTTLILVAATLGIIFGFKLY